MKQFGSEGIETPFDMPETPEGWQIALLGQIAQIVGGGTPKTSDSSNFSEGEYPWITPADLSGFNEMYISRGRRSLSEQGLKTSSALLMPKGTVLMSSRAPIGYLAIAANELCTNQGFKSFICSPGVTPEYVFFWLKLITPFLENMGSGSTFLEISGNRARKIPILLAPTSEQKRIIAKVEELLARVNTAKERLNKVPKILKRFRQAVLAAACSGPLTANWREEHVEIEPVTLNSKVNELPETLEALQEIKPSSWTFASVKKIANTIQYGYTASAKQEPVGPKFLRITDIQNGQVNWSDVPYCAIPDDKIAKFLLLPGDILFTRTGATTGKSFLIRSCPRAVFASYLIRVQPAPVVDSKFLYLFFQSDLYWKQIAENIAGSAQPNCNASKLATLILPLPPIPEQLEIARQVDVLFKLADEIEKRVAAATTRAEKLTQAILAKAFRAELVPTEAELARRERRSYETASELLARIKSERDAKQTSQKVRSSWVQRKTV